MSSTDSQRRRPLDGVTVVEFEAIGPVPFACGILADMGATVTRIGRPGGNRLPGSLGTTSSVIGDVVAVDLKSDQGRDQALALIRNADVAIEGFRPGTLERLGLGPDVLQQNNEQLVIARVTGWGQRGPYATMAGHDINYIALTGALHAIGPADLPVPPLNLVGDFGGGGMYAVAGILGALVERNETGMGCVIDVAMVDGAASLLGPIRAIYNLGMWEDERGANLLDGGAPFYRTYRTQDGRFMAVGALEPAFYSELLEGLGIDEGGIPDRMDRENWPALADLFASMFVQRPRDDWQLVFDGSDACVTPVLTIAEAATHPHNAERAAIVEDPDGPRPAPAPRFGVS